MIIMKTKIKIILAATTTIIMIMIKKLINSLS